MTKIEYKLADNLDKIAKMGLIPKTWLLEIWLAEALKIKKNIFGRNGQSETFYKNVLTNLIC